MKEEKQCKAYTQGTGAYASFTSGEQCKRKATVDGYCNQHSKK
ncbi:DUF5763 domain-containing protein [Klebsiella oxytoca]